MIKKLSNIIYKILLFHRLKKSTYEKVFFDKSDFILVTIAFNNLEVLTIQHRYLKELLKDPFDYVIADNSSKKEDSLKIRLFCEQNKISYIKIPNNPLTNIRASGSHGVALNWCHRNIIKKYKPKYFGFLDHDIFPIKEVSIVGNMGSGFYGVIRNKKEPYWYMWPGFSFYTYEKSSKYSFNFFPHHSGLAGEIFLDTGGSNFYSIYRKVGKQNIHIAQSRLINMTTEKALEKGEDSSQTFEIIDSSWLHLRQISWREESSGKLSELDKIIEVAKKFTN